MSSDEEGKSSVCESPPAPRTGGDSVPAEAHQALQVAMDKLQVRELPPSGVQEGWGPLWAGRC